MNDSELEIWTTFHVLARVSPEVLADANRANEMLIALSSFEQALKMLIKKYQDKEGLVLTFSEATD
jgi:hypothetical protein